MFSGWMIDAQDRAKLMRQFPPLFEVEVVSHVTQSVSRDSKVEFPIDAKIVIYDMIVADGMQIALVSVNGKTTRPDGETYAFVAGIIHRIGLHQRWQSIFDYAIDGREFFPVRTFVPSP